MFHSLVFGIKTIERLADLRSCDVPPEVPRPVVTSAFPNGFTGRAQNSAPPLTPRRERASGKALAFIGTNLEVYILDGSVHNAIQPGGINS
jgi:hypothetical protein